MFPCPSGVGISDGVFIFHAEACDGVDDTLHEVLFVENGCQGVGMLDCDFVFFFFVLFVFTV